MMSHIIATTTDHPPGQLFVSFSLHFAGTDADHNSRMSRRARSFPEVSPGPPPGRVSTWTLPGCFRAARSHQDAMCSSAPSPGSVSAAQHAEINFANSDKV